MTYDNRNSGAFFKNTKKREGKSDPDYTGTLNADGQEYWASVWVNESKKGQKYFSIKINKKDEHNQETGEIDMNQDIEEDEIPF